MSAGTQNRIPTLWKLPVSFRAICALRVSSGSFIHASYSGDSRTARNESASTEKTTPFSSSSFASANIPFRFRCTFSLESFPAQTARVRCSNAFWHRSTPSCPLRMKIIITSVCDPCLVTLRASKVILTSKRSCQRCPPGCTPTVRTSTLPESEVAIVCMIRLASISTARLRLMR